MAEPAFDVERCNAWQAALREAEERREKQYRRETRRLARKDEMAGGGDAGLRPTDYPVRRTLRR